MSADFFPKLPAERRLVPRRVFLALGLLALVLGTLVFPFPMRGRLWGDIFDLAHAPVFCLALICLVGFLDPAAAGLPSRYQTIVPMTLVRAGLITLVLMAAGMIGEYLQRFAGRNPSWGDVAANTAGLTAGLFWVASRATTGSKRTLLSVIPFVILICVSVNPALEALDSVARIRQFPLIASFERRRELGNWGTHGATMSRSGEWSTDGRSSLNVTLQPGEYPGVAMLWLEQTWSGFRQFHMDVRNPEPRPLQLIIKLQDQQHSETGFAYEDRFHQQFTIPAEDTLHVAIDLAKVRTAPAEREMNMDQINMIDVYGVDVQQPTVFQIDNLKLTR